MVSLHVPWGAHKGRLPLHRSPGSRRGCCHQPRLRQASPDSRLVEARRREAARRDAQLWAGSRRKEKTERRPSIVSKLTRASPAARASRRRGRRRVEPSTRASRAESHDASSRIESSALTTTSGTAPHSSQGNMKDLGLERTQGACTIAHASALQPTTICLDEAQPSSCGKGASGGRTTCTGAKGGAESPPHPALIAVSRERPAITRRGRVLTALPPAESGVTSD